jgi:peroxiredoxin Q/BCP
MLNEADDKRGPNRELKVGDQAPDFTLPTQGGGELHLADVVKERAVVLFFYPKNFSPVCTAEACAFRDQYEVFKDAGAQVIGISSDPPASHEKFAKEHRLPYPLVSDFNGHIRELFGVPKAMWLFAGRTTYVIDRERVVRHIFTSQLASDAHVNEALAIVKKIAKAS